MLEVSWLMTGSQTQRLNAFEANDRVGQASLSTVHPINCENSGVELLCTPHYNASKTLFDCCMSYSASRAVLDGTMAPHLTMTHCQDLLLLQRILSLQAWLAQQPCLKRPAAFSLGIDGRKACTAMTQHFHLSSGGSCKTALICLAAGTSALIEAEGNTRSVGAAGSFLLYCQPTKEH